MSYKDLLVALDDGARSRDRLEIAAALGMRFGAHLIGLYVTGVPARPGRFDFFNPALIGPYYGQAEELNREQRDRAQALFEQISARHAVSAEWRSAVGYPSDIVALHGRYADLIILGQPDPDDITAAALLQPFPDEVVLATGRPALIIPYAGNFEQIGRRVLVGWDTSREATRAVNDALPLLRQANSVTVLSINPGVEPDGHGEVPGADIALHLARHGVTATVERTVGTDIGAGDVLLSRASDLQADLLVVGAYGHSRARELVLGGVTETVLRTMTLPVLMAH